MTEVNNESNIKEECKSLYQDLREMEFGSDEEIDKTVKEFYYDEGSNLSGDDSAVTLRKSYSLDDLNACEPIAILGGWKKLTVPQKKKVLWGLGLDIHQFGWFSAKRLHRNHENKLVFGIELYSQERTDRTWGRKTIGNASVASLEAAGCRDAELGRDLKRLANTGNGVFAGGDADEARMSSNTKSKNSWDKAAKKNS